MCIYKYKYDIIVSINPIFSNEKARTILSRKLCSCVVLDDSGLAFYKYGMGFMLDIIKAVPLPRVVKK